MQSSMRLRADADSRGTVPHELCTGGYASVFLQNDIQVSSAKVYERTGDAVICYDGSRAELIDKLRHFHYEDVEVPNRLIENSGRELNASYQEKLIGRVVRRYASKIFLPYPILACWTTVKSFRYIWKGIKTLAARKIEVPVLMRRRSECLFCAVIPRRRDRSCSCLASASC